MELQYCHCSSTSMLLLVFFFFNDTATTEIYTLSLHDALPISCSPQPIQSRGVRIMRALIEKDEHDLDRKSTRLNSSHANISYAVFCLKKKKIETDASRHKTRQCCIVWNSRLNTKCQNT